MRYISLDIQCRNKAHCEILIALLSNLGFDSFEERLSGIFTSIEVDQWNEKLVLDLFRNYKNSFKLEWTVEELEKINWNKKWEMNFDPVIIDNKISIRSPFHPIQPCKYEILIMPKMSFGTGHHDTTKLMLRHQLKIDHINKSILDIGTGTGILTIMAKHLGATHLEATDIDNWCIENSKTNFALNSLRNQAIVHLGTITQVNPAGKFDIILANLHKNILCEEIPHYKSLLKNKGRLVVSGFYQEDNAEIMKVCTNQGLCVSGNITAESKWSALSFKKGM